MIIHGPVRPDVDPELASLAPVVASEWYGYVPGRQTPPASALMAALRARGSGQLAEIVEAVASDPRWGWLAVHAELLRALTERQPADSLDWRVEEWLRLNGVRVIGVAGASRP